MSNNNTSKRPVHEIRYGNVKVVIWCNQTQSGPMHNVNVSRLYKDGDQWKESNGFGQDDLLTLAKALDEAHTWIHRQRASQKNEKAAA